MKSIRIFLILCLLAWLPVSPVSGETKRQVNENDPQTLTNKTLTAPAVTNPTITGTIGGSPTITSPSITGTVGGSGTYTSPTLAGATLGGTKALDTNWVSAERFVDLQQAVTQLGTTPTTLLITSSKPITANITFPSTLSLQFVSPGKLTCTTAGVLITINGSIQAGIQQIFQFSGGCGLAPSSTGIFVPHWWGITAIDGTGNQAPAFQAAFDAGISTAIPCGNYGIGTMLTISNVSGRRVLGVGGSGQAETCVTFTWTGAAGGTLWKLTGVRDSIFENIRITVGPAPSTLAAAMDFDPTGRSQPETNITLRAISVIQRTGCTTVDNSITIGIRVSRSTSPGNVEDFTFDNLNVCGMSSAGVSIEHGQSKNHQFIFLKCAFAARCVTNVLNGSTGGTFNVVGGDVGNNNTADFVVSGTGVDSIHLSDIHMESSKRFLIAMPGSNASVNITVKGCSMAGSSSLHADGQVIVIGDATPTSGVGGPVILQGNSFYANDAATAAKIGFNQSNGVLISEGNTYNNTAPFVNNGGVTDLYSSGDFAWTGAVFVKLPSLPGSVNRDVTQIDVVSTVAQTTVHTTTIPAGFLGSNRGLRITIQGDFLNNTGGALNNPAILLSYGAGIIVTLPSSTSFAAAATRYSWSITFTMSSKSTSSHNATGRITFMPFADDGTLPAPTLDVPFMTNQVGYAVGGVDSTVSKDFTIKITNAANNAQYSTRKNSVQIESF